MIILKSETRVGNSGPPETGPPESLSHPFGQVRLLSLLPPPPPPPPLVVVPAATETGGCVPSSSPVVVGVPFSANLAVIVVVVVDRFSTFKINRYFYRTKSPIPTSTIRRSATSNYHFYSLYLPRIPSFPSSSNRIRLKNYYRHEQ